MTFLTIPFGLLLPTIAGWLLLGLLQGKEAVLWKGERLALAFLLGNTLTMFLVFCTHIVFGLSLSFWGFIAIQSLEIIFLGITTSLKQIPFFSAKEARTQEAESTLVKTCLWILGAWTALKVVTLGTTFVFLVPTFFDDSVDNWNLRAKVFFHTQNLELVLPGRGGAAADVSSYPPTVPLVKTWMADVAGWSDGAVNAPHLAWFLCVLTLLYYGLRRSLSRAWSSFGVYALVSMPLYLMHGTNAYADVFMGAHVFAAVAYFFHAMREQDVGVRLSLLKISAVATAMLPFTKNEGLLLYLPPMALLVVAYLATEWRKGAQAKELFRVTLWYAVPALLVLIPWIAYKYANGLTFGNAKSVGELGFGWQPQVPFAVAVNTFFEGNWLLLFPLLAALLAWRWRAAFTSFLPLTAFFLIVYVGQMFLYMFTGLSAEAIMQTGYARGIIQLLPVALLLTVLLLKDAYDRMQTDDALAR